MILPMAKESYTDEFRRQAVDQYESTPGATLRGIADDLGISRGTLADWEHARYGFDDRPDQRPEDPAGEAGDTGGREGCPARGRGRCFAGGEGEGRDREVDPASGG